MCLCGRTEERRTDRQCEPLGGGGCVRTSQWSFPPKAKVRKTHARMPTPHSWSFFYYYYDDDLNVRTNVIQKCQSLCNINNNKDIQHQQLLWSQELAKKIENKDALLWSVSWSKTGHWTRTHSVLSVKPFIAFNSGSRERKQAKKKTSHRMVQRQKVEPQDWGRGEGLWTPTAPPLSIIIAKREDDLVRPCCF